MKHVPFDIAMKSRFWNMAFHNQGCGVGSPIIRLRLLAISIIRLRLQLRLRLRPSAVLVT